MGSRTEGACGQRRLVQSLVARVERAIRLGLPKPKAAIERLADIFKRTPRKRHKCPGCGVGGHSRNASAQPAGVNGEMVRGGTRVG